MILYPKCDCTNEPIIQRVEGQRMCDKNKIATNFLPIHKMERALGRKQFHQNYRGRTILIFDYDTDIVYICISVEHCGIDIHVLAYMCIGTDRIYFRNMRRNVAYFDEGRYRTFLGSICNWKIVESIS